MKFSTVFSTLLCVLSLGVYAAPVDFQEESQALVERAPPATLTPTVVTTAFRIAVQGVVGHALVDGTTYVFTFTTPFVPTGTDKALDALRKSLGYNHIWLMMGKLSRI
jgi:hypothetical protein